jgi:hypothetical protein
VAEARPGSEFNRMRANWTGTEFPGPPENRTNGSEFCVRRGLPSKTGIPVMMGAQPGESADYPAYVQKVFKQTGKQIGIVWARMSFV